MSSTMRRVAACLFAICAAWTAASCTSRGASKYWQKLVVLGFDGMDPDLVDRWMKEGKLPNIRRIVDQGGLYPLSTTHSAESPTAWASFATGVNPGKHNIYDFLVRDFETYLPDLAGVKREPPVFKWGFLPTQRPKITSTRGGTSFWTQAGKDGIKSVILTVPMTFPLEDIEHGQLLGGLPVPDIRGTMGTFNYWATDLSSFEEGNTEFGGFLKRLLFDAGVAKPLLKGPESPILKQEEAELREKKKAGPLDDDDARRLEELSTGKDVSIPFSVKWTEGSGQAEIE